MWFMFAHKDRPNGFPTSKYVFKTVKNSHISLNQTYILQNSIMIQQYYAEREQLHKVMNILMLAVSMTQMKPCPSRCQFQTICFFRSRSLFMCRGKPALKVQITVFVFFTLLHDTFMYDTIIWKDLVEHGGKHIQTLVQVSLQQLL